jgi:hypothetical protein
MQEQEWSDNPANENDVIRPVAWSLHTPPQIFAKTMPSGTLSRQYNTNWGICDNWRINLSRNQTVALYTNTCSIVH